MARIKLQAGFKEDSRVGKAWEKVQVASRRRLGADATISEIIQDLILAEERHLNKASRHSHLNLSHLMIQDMWLTQMREVDKRPEHVLLKELEERAAELFSDERDCRRTL